MSFTYELLEQSEKAYLKLLNKISNIKEDGILDKELYITYDDKFKEYISNDLNTSNDITIIYDVLKADLNNTFLFRNGASESMHHL